MNLKKYLGATGVMIYDDKTITKKLGKYGYYPITQMTLFHQQDDTRRKSILVAKDE